MPREREGVHHQCEAQQVGRLAQATLAACAVPVNRWYVMTWVRSARQLVFLPLACHRFEQRNRRAGVRRRRAGKDHPRWDVAFRVGLSFHAVRLMTSRRNASAGRLDTRSSRVGDKDLDADARGASRARSSSRRDVSPPHQEGACHHQHYGVAREHEGSPQQASLISGKGERHAFVTR